MNKLTFEKPLVMGILNVTPDSFSDGGKYDSVDKAAKRFEEMVEEGADIIDIGGESTGPGSKDVSVDEEIERVIPVLKKVRPLSDIPISIDTYKSRIAQEAIKNGADMINDILALRGDEKMAPTIAKSDVPIILMYSKNKTGRSSFEDKEYDDVIQHIYSFFEERLKFAEKNGINLSRIIIDPGQGAFVSANPKYSLQILKHLKEFKKLGRPLLVGSSRKSFIGHTLDLPLNKRLEGSLVCAAIAIINGASIVRVHDVKETQRMIDMLKATQKI